MPAPAHVFISDIPKRWTEDDVKSVVSAGCRKLFSKCVQARCLLRGGLVHGAVLRFSTGEAAHDVAMLLDGKMVRDGPRRHQLRAAAAVASDTDHNRREDLRQYAPSKLIRLRLSNLPRDFMSLDVAALLDAFGMHPIEILMLYFDGGAAASIVLEDTPTAQQATHHLCDLQLPLCEVPLEACLAPGKLHRAPEALLMWVPARYQSLRGAPDWYNPPHTEHVMIRVYDEDGADSVYEDLLVQALDDYLPRRPRVRMCPSPQPELYSLASATLQSPHAVADCVRELSSRYIYETGQMRLCIRPDGPACPNRLTGGKRTAADLADDHLATSEDLLGEAGQPSPAGEWVRTTPPHQQPEGSSLPARQRGVHPQWPTPVRGLGG